MPTPGEGRAVVAGEQPVDPPPDRQLESLEALGRDRARARARGCPLAPDGGDEPLHATAERWRPRSICGAANAARTLVEHLVGGDLLREGLVGEDEPVAEGVAHDRLDVGREDVVAAAQHRERARGSDHADRPARARAVRDVRRDRLETVLGGLAGRGREVDDPAHERRVDEDLADHPLQRLQLLDREHRLERGRGSSERWTTVSSSSWAG